MEVAVSTRIFGVFVLCLAALVAACVSVSPPTYYAEPHPPLDSATVQVFNVEPPFVYERIGEFTVDACPACKEPQIRAKIQETAAVMGGDVAVIVSRSAGRSVGVVNPNPYLSTVAVNTDENLVVVVGRRSP